VTAPRGVRLPPLQLRLLLTLPSPEHKLQIAGGNHRRVAAEGQGGSEAPAEDSMALGDVQLLEIWVRPCRRAPAGTF